MNPIILAAEAGPNPLAPHLVEIILSLVVFGLLFLAVKKWVVPSFETTFADRTAAIEGGLVAREELFLQTKFTFRPGQDHRLPYDPDAPIPVQVMKVAMCPNAPGSMRSESAQNAARAESPRVIARCQRRYQLWSPTESAARPSATSLCTEAVSPFAWAISTM